MLNWDIVSITIKWQSPGHKFIRFWHIILSPNWKKSSVEKVFRHGWIERVKWYHKIWSYSILFSAQLSFLAIPFSGGLLSWYQDGYQNSRFTFILCGNSTLLTLRLGLNEVLNLWPKEMWWFSGHISTPTKTHWLIMYSKKLSRKNMLLFSKGGMMMMIDDRQTDR